MHGPGDVIALGPEASEQWLALSKQPPPDWLQRVIEARAQRRALLVPLKGRIKALERYIDAGRPYDPAEED